MSSFFSYDDETEDDKVVGQFPVSIATSLAIEGLFGVLEDNPNPNPPWKSYNYLLINFRTMFRNLIGAISAEHRDALNVLDFVDMVIEEMRVVKNIVETHSEGKITVAYYACGYSDLTGFYPYALFKEAKTAKQQHYAHMENETYNHAYRTLGGVGNGILSTYDTNIPSLAKNTLVLTHYPVDLLNIEGAISLALLESHTGIVKVRSEWGSKLNNHKDCPRVPFDRMTVQVFGDSGGLFKPYPIDFRKRLIVLSETYKWNGTTTKDRIIQCVELAKDPVLLLEVRKLYFI